jgi:hypothetical protein
MFKSTDFAAISGDVALLAAFTAVMLLLAGAIPKRSLRRNRVYLLAVMPVA